MDGIINEIEESVVVSEFLNDVSAMSVYEEKSVIEETQPDTIEEETPLQEEKPEEVVPEPEIPVESAPVLQYNWDSVVREGLFSKIMCSNLSETEEEMWVKKFAKTGLAFRTILGPPRTDVEVLTRLERDEEDTWVNYKQIKQFMKGK